MDEWRVNRPPKHSGQNSTRLIEVIRSGTIHSLPQSIRVNDLPKGIPLAISYTHSESCSQEPPEGSVALQFAEENMERRKFLGAAGMLIGSSVVDQAKMTSLVPDSHAHPKGVDDKASSPHSLDPCLPKTQNLTWNPSVPKISAQPLVLPPFANHASTQGQPAD